MSGISLCLCESTSTTAYIRLFGFFLNVMYSTPMCEKKKKEKHHLSPSNGYGHPFSFSAVVNKAAVTILVQIFLCTQACISLGCVSRNETAGLLGGVF